MLKILHRCFHGGPAGLVLVCSAVCHAKTAPPQTTAGEGEGRNRRLRAVARALVSASTDPERASNRVATTCPAESTAICTTELDNNWALGQEGSSAGALSCRPASSPR